MPKNNKHVSDFQYLKTPESLRLSQKLKQLATPSAKNVKRDQRKE